MREEKEEKGRKRKGKRREGEGKKELEMISTTGGRGKPPEQTKW